MLKAILIAKLRISNVEIAALKIAFELISD